MTRQYEHLLVLRHDFNGLTHRTCFPMFITPMFAIFVFRIEIKLLKKHIIYDSQFEMIKRPLGPETIVGMRGPIGR